MTLFLDLSELLRWCIFQRPGISRNSASWTRHVPVQDDRGLANSRNLVHTNHFARLKTYHLQVTKNN